MKYFSLFFSILLFISFSTSSVLAGKGGRSDEKVQSSPAKKLASKKRSQEQITSSPNKLGPSSSEAKKVKFPTDSDEELFQDPKFWQEFDRIANQHTSQNKTPRPNPSPVLLAKTENSYDELPSEFWQELKKIENGYSQKSAHLYSNASQVQEKTSDISEEDFWRDAAKQAEIIEQAHFQQNASVFLISSPISHPLLGNPDEKFSLEFWEEFDEIVSQRSQKSSGQVSNGLDNTSQSSEEVSEEPGENSISPFSPEFWEEFDEIVSQRSQKSSGQVSNGLDNTSQSSEEVSEEPDEDSISPNEKSELLPVERLMSFTDSLAHLHSLEAHRDFIAEVLNTAQTRLVFCSPFINSKSGYQMDFTIEKLWGAVSRGVDVTFVVRKNTNYLWSFKKYLGKLLHQKNFHLVEKSNFHSKIVVVDEDGIAEGSFNWLSASRDEGSQYHNHEATFVCRGEAARPLIQDFLKKVDSE